MKRALFGFLWFIALSVGGVVIGGALVGGIAGSKVQASSVAEGYEKGKDAGTVAGTEFGSNYGGAIFISALVISIAGTAFGFLPGTKARKKTS